MVLQNDSPRVQVLEGRVYFDPLRRQLYTSLAQVELKEHEARLLSALLSGVQDKRKIIEILWESRGVIVTENNYYKVVKGLRNAFDAIGLPSELLKTMPRVGLAYVGHAAEQVADAEPVLATCQEAPEAPVVVAVASESGVAWSARAYSGLLLLLIALFASWCAYMLLQSDNGFRLLGSQDGIKVYVYKDPGMPVGDILSRYRRFAVEQPTTRYLYYREVGKNYIILACPTALPDGAESCVSLMQKNI